MDYLHNEVRCTMKSRIKMLPFEILVDFSLLLRIERIPMIIQLEFSAYVTHDPYTKK